MYYVYILLSEKDGKFYTGSTNDLKRRINEHYSGQVDSTKDRLPMKLIYYEACIDEIDARAREKYLKSGMGKRYIRNRLKYYLKDL
jgi:putative endonuclease